MALSLLGALEPFYDEPAFSPAAFYPRRGARNELGIPLPHLGQLASSLQVNCDVIEKPTSYAIVAGG
jgi:hypothetical protein